MKLRGFIIPVLVLFSLALAASTSGPTLQKKLEVQVLCSNCGIPQEPDSSHLVMLDQDSGEVWAYRDLYEKPVFLGKLSRLGEPLTRVYSPK